MILSAYDYPGNFRTIELLGATPVLVDIADDSPCIDAAQIESAASPKVVAVIASHLYGRAAAVQPLRNICDDSRWFLIEDACQVPGMTIDHSPAGSFGDLAAVSFGGSKLISSGTGGAILCRNDRLAARLSSIIDRPSDTFPLSPLQAAVIGPQLDRLAELNQRRAAAAKYLIDRLPAVDWVSRIDSHVEPAFYKLAWRQPVDRPPAAQGSTRADSVPTGGRGSARATSSSSAGVSSSPHESLPIGKGFRAMANVSARRCRKPVALERSMELSENCLLLDHRALLVEADQYADLSDAIRRRFAL